MTANILDPQFRYTKAVATDIRETFRRERLRLKRIDEQRARDEQEAAGKVKTITRRTR